jgi:hypothetical protein
MPRIQAGRIAFLPVVLISSEIDIRNVRPPAAAGCNGIGFIVAEIAGT